MVSAYYISVAKYKEKKRPRLRLEDNIKMDLREIVCVTMRAGLMRLRI
jgi:hypothetical protein